MKKQFNIDFSLPKILFTLIHDGGSLSFSSFSGAYLERDGKGKAALGDKRNVSPPVACFRRRLQKQEAKKLFTVTFATSEIRMIKRGGNKYSLGALKQETPFLPSPVIPNATLDHGNRRASRFGACIRGNKKIIRVHCAQKIKRVKEVLLAFEAQN